MLLSLPPFLFIVIDILIRKKQKDKHNQSQPWEKSKSQSGRLIVGKKKKMDGVEKSRLWDPFTARNSMEELNLK